MINTQELEQPYPAKGSKQLANKKKRYHVDSANNFICYENLKLLVSEPKKYFMVHIVLISGMVYFYVLTFVVALIVYEINYVVIALHVVATCLLVILGFKNPGIVLKITEDFDNPSKIQLPFDKDAKPAVNELAKSYAIPIKSHLIRLKFCPQCLIYTPPRTVHCWVCNACIINMDHHCPFIGNCVGKGNYQIFFTFVSFLTIKLILIITQLIIMIVKLFERDHSDTFKKPQLYFTFVLLVFCFVVLCFVGSLMGFHIYLILNSVTTNEFCKDTWNTLSGNPFRKNFCLKNIFRFIRGPADQSIHHSQQNLQKTVIAREKDKSEQYLSEYQSQDYVKQKTQSNSNTASHIRSQGPQKPQISDTRQMSNTRENMISGNQRTTSI